MSTTYPITCPACKQSLIITLTEDMLEPLRISIPLQLEDGHALTLDTTHYAESNQSVSRLLMVVITHCPKTHNEKHNQLVGLSEVTKEITTEELREAAIWFYCKYFTESFDQEQVAYLIRLGWKLAQPGGLAHIHPRWLERCRKELQSNKQM